MVEFKKYLIAWLIYMPISFVIGLTIGTIAYFVPELDLIGEFISLVLCIIALYYVAKYRQISFWKFLGFNILANVMLWLVIFIIGVIIVALM